MEKKGFKIVSYLTVIICCFSVFIRPVEITDELWNYNFARNILEGRIPYVDFSMVPTPLSAYIGALFLYLFGNNLFAFRIASYVLMSITFCLLYKICSNVSKNETISFVATMYMFSLSYITWIYSYNNLNLCLLLLIILMEYKQENKNQKNKSNILNLIIGLLVGLTPLVKQSTGIILFLGNIVICWIDYIYYEKERKNIIIRMITSVLPGSIYVIILLSNGSFWGFYDYTIRGIATFTHYISYFEYIFSHFIAFATGTFPIFVIIYSVICFIKGKLYTSRRFYIVVFIFSLAGSMVAYPLCDFNHMLTAIVPFIPLLLCCVKQKCYKREKSVLCIIVSTFVTFFLIFRFIPSKEIYKESDLMHFEKIAILADAEQGIKEVNEYILEQNEQGIDVYIADETAVVYMIPLNKYNKDFDMLMVGNMGSQSMEDLLNGKEGAIFLVCKDETHLGYQSYFELIHYIKENYKYVGEVRHFEAYQAIK